jgi:hypothetical protein
MCLKIVVLAKRTVLKVHVAIKVLHFDAFMKKTNFHAIFNGRPCEEFSSLTTPLRSSTESRSSWSVLIRGRCYPS